MVYVREGWRDKNRCLPRGKKDEKERERERARERESSVKEDQSASERQKGPREGLAKDVLSFGCSFRSRVNSLPFQMSRFRASAFRFFFNHNLFIYIYLFIYSLIYIILFIYLFTFESLFA